MALPDTTAATLALITRFEENFNTRDIDALMADMTEDAVFEHVAPAAASVGRHQGQAAVRAMWVSMETHFPAYTIEVVDIFAAGDRCSCQYILRWRTTPEGAQALARGVNIYTVRNGKIAEKLAYLTL